MSSIYVVFKPDSNASYTTLNLYPDYADSAFKTPDNWKPPALKKYIMVIFTWFPEGPVTKTHM